MSTATIPDLWPTDLDPSDSEPPPAAILRQQGQLLGQRTGNVVYGEVESQSNTGQSGDEFNHYFYLNCAYLGYRRLLLSVRHGLAPYPAQFFSKTLPESRDASEHRISSSDGLVDALRDTFAREDVVKVIRSLRTQMRDLDDE
jgi:hypothetical protein